MAALGILLRTGARRLHGGRWRGRGVRGDSSRAWLPISRATGYGPLTELPGWSYSDGRPAPPMKGQLRRLAQREKFARRVVLLSQEMDAGLEAWQLKQQQTVQEEQKKENALKRKGAARQSPPPRQ